jgi:hypothetical protein
LARHSAQARFLSGGATVHGFEANGTNPNVRFTRRRELLPVLRTFITVELLTIKDARHAFKVGVKTKNVKLGGPLA